jgi:DUF4097 and DUF4098 domain-containing protein YvlB
VTTSQQRRSILSGLLLIFLGVIFLLYRFEPQLDVGRLIWRFWPVLFILWGVAKLVDHLAARRTGEHTTVLSGGEAALLILVCFALAALGLVDHIRKRHPDFDLRVNPFSQKYSQTEALPTKKIGAGAHIAIQTARGSISVHAGDGDELRVTANKSASDSNESEADRRMEEVKAVIEQTSDGYRVYPANQKDSDGDVGVDLEVEIPRKASVTATTSRGDITLAGVAGAIDADTHNGDVEIHDAGSDVAVKLEKGDLRITGVAGNLRLSGRGNEIDVSDVAGDATLNGEFFGPIRVRNVVKTTHYTSQRSDLTLIHMTGRLELDSADLQVSDVAGSAKLTTHNKDIDVENVAGRLDIANSHGDVKIHYSQPPSDEINVTDDSGEVQLTLPGKSGFEISAFSRGGEIATDFEGPALQQTNDGNVGKLNGKFGSHGPKITIVTSYGTISLHKSS